MSQISRSKQFGKQTTFPGPFGINSINEIDIKTYVHRDYLITNKFNQDTWMIVFQ